MGFSQLPRFLGVDRSSGRAYGLEVVRAMGQTVANCHHLKSWGSSAGAEVYRIRMGQAFPALIVHVYGIHLSMNISCG